MLIFQPGLNILKFTVILKQKLHNVKFCVSGIQFLFVNLCISNIGIQYFFMNISKFAKCTQKETARLITPNKMKLYDKSEIEFTILHSHI
jgi:hypothetical protein